MRILVVGGTRFVGRYVVEAALARGHDVTVLHRGQGGDDPFPEAEHVHLDRDGDLAALAGRVFDATVDSSAYFPEQVARLVDVLGDGAGRYLVVSSVSAYDVPEAAGFDEASPLLAPSAPGETELTGETYGPLKVAIEQLVLDRFGARGTVVRPTYVVGPHDYTARFPYWVERIAEGGEVLAPGRSDAPMQVVDARDMGAWMVGLLEQGIGGAFHAATPAPPWGWGDLLEGIAAAVGPAGTTFTWVDDSWLLEQGENGSSIPLWGEGDPGDLVLAADPAAAYASGLAPRPYADTVRDTLAWSREHGIARSQSRVGAGDAPITREREAELLAAWHARGA